MIRRPPRSTQGVSSAASDVYKRQVSTQSTWVSSMHWLVGNSPQITSMGKKSRSPSILKKIVKPNDVLVIDNLGLPQFNQGSGNGKLYLITSIKFPSSLEETKHSNLIACLEPFARKLELKEAVDEKCVMKDFHPNQKNIREDGEVGPTDEESRDHGPRVGGGIPCEAQQLHTLIFITCLLYTSPSPRDLSTSRMPSSA
eukprot:TRINITY_DN6124_c0_g1_i4.p1 TRINITY_DN6124_c0_g1~~TRINITY_DN6124_c0_g1_i4.p1  ORF type:complete len:199 (+),score=48.13 TRINITY_DN6124_c0_g1_i4:128-724(+)